MERRLFNLYLKYIEQNCPSIRKQFKKMPRNIKCYIAGMGISYVFAIIFLCISKSLNELWYSITSVGSILLFISCAIFGILLDLSTGKYEIEVSDKTIKEYWSYCFGVRTWFLNEFISEELSEEDLNDNIIEVKNRIDMYLLEQSQKIEKRNSRIDTWVQALAIPFVLAIITSVLDKSNDTVNAISEIFSILLAFIALFGIIWAIYSVGRAFKRQKFEQMKRFSEDLQGAMDCQKYAPDTSALNNENDTKINV